LSTPVLTRFFPPLCLLHPYFLMLHNGQVEFVSTFCPLRQVDMYARYASRRDQRQLDEGFNFKQIFEAIIPSTRSGCRSGYNRALRRTLQLAGPRRTGETK
jgi:hypothetical protein